MLEILDSSHAGEALAAAKLASTMVREAGLTWDEVLAPSIVPRGVATSARPAGTGPFGYRKDRELSPHEQFFMVLLSPRTPAELKRKLRGWKRASSMARSRRRNRSISNRCTRATWPEARLGKSGLFLPHSNGEVPSSYEGDGS